MTKKIVSWNVNGLRAMMKKSDLQTLVATKSPDILCLQEVRCEDKDAERLITKDTLLNSTYPYRIFNHCKIKAPGKHFGYSGTGILSKSPITVLDIPDSLLDEEGRVILFKIQDMPQVTFINVYTPNSGEQLKALPRRMSWDAAFTEMVTELLEEHDHLLVCGDLNVAIEEIDVHQSGRNTKFPGYSDKERQSAKLF